MPYRHTHRRRPKPKSNGHPPTIPATAPMPLVSFTDEAHFDPNGVLEINRMEEYPSHDIAPMVVYEEEDTEDMFLFRDYSVCKGDKI